MRPGSAPSAAARAPHSQLTLVLQDGHARELDEGFIQAVWIRADRVCQCCEVVMLGQANLQVAVGGCENGGEVRFPMFPFTRLAKDSADA